MAKKKIMIVDPIDPIKETEKIKLVKPENFKSKTGKKYVKKETTLLEKIKHFLNKLTLR